MKKCFFILLWTSIILFIAALYFAGTNTSRPSSKKTAARTAMGQLKDGCDDYFEEYQQYPLGSTTNQDTVVLTTGNGSKTLMMELIGDGLIRGREESYKRQCFFTYKESIGRKNGLLLTETTAELFDPWGNSYHVLFDYDDDRKLKDPFTGRTISDIGVLIWSPGPDKKFGTPKTDKDNVYSWES